METSMIIVLHMSQCDLPVWQRLLAYNAESTALNCC